MLSAVPTPSKFPHNLAKKVLYDTFHHEEFREHQLDLIKCGFEGGSYLFVAATGYGKSVPIQLTPILRGKPAIIIEPTISLMRDQIRKMRALGIRAIGIHSQQDEDIQHEMVKRVAAGNYDLLYMSPEKLSTELVIGAVTASGKRISGLAVDEAHCVSLWGHSFRPAFLRIAEIRKQLGSPPLWLLTATATRFVEEDILSVLGVPGIKVLRTPPIRENIEFERIVLESEWDKRRYLTELFKNDKSTRPPTVVYCARRRTTESISRLLFEHGFENEHYHGGMEREARITADDRFMEGKTSCLIATNAFGMGVDKSDIRRVFHYEVPASLEHLVQEAGRAGRDGLPAKHVLLFTPRDAYLQLEYCEGANPGPDRIMQVFDMLWRPIKGKSFINGEPLQRSFSDSAFLEYFADASPRFRHQLAASLAILEEFGLISRRGRMLTFHKTLDEVQRDGFGISPEVLENRYRLTVWRVNQMLRFALSSEEPRKILEEYFAASMMDIPKDIPSLEELFQHRIPVSQVSVDCVLKALSHQCYRKASFSYDMRTGLESLKVKLAESENLLEGLKKKRGAKRKEAVEDQGKIVDRLRKRIDKLGKMDLGSLSYLNATELEIVMKTLEKRSLIRKAQVGRTCMIGLTLDGVDKIKDETKRPPAEPTTYKHLTDHWLLPSYLSIIRQYFRTLQNELKQEEERGKRADPWGIIEDFLKNTEIKVIDRNVKGKVLVSDLLRRRRILLRDVVGLINYLNPKDPLKLTSK